MRDASSALGVDPYTWVLGGGDDHALAATFPYQRAYLPVSRKVDGTLHSW